MDYVYFDSEGLYLECKTDLREKITAIEAIQAALLTTALKAAGTGNMTEYMLNDGQTIIKTVYRNSEEIIKAYDDYERIRQRLINQINGRMTRLVDSKNFILNGSTR